jgi:hypothetical protein
MKKFILIPAALFFLAFSAAWAQVPPPHRKHTRPPYSGPKKTGIKAKGPSHRPRTTKNLNSVPVPVPISNHIIVR